jgi:hypothetical protein
MYSLVLMVIVVVVVVVVAAAFPSILARTAEYIPNNSN